MRWEVIGPYKEGEVIHCRAHYDDFDEYLKALDAELSTNFGPGTESKIEIYDDPCEATRGVILWRQGPDGYYGKIMLISMRGLMVSGYYGGEFSKFFRETQEKFHSLIKGAIGERSQLSS